MKKGEHGFALSGDVFELDCSIVLMKKHKGKSYDKYTEKHIKSI